LNGLNGLNDRCCNRFKPFKFFKLLLVGAGDYS
jgi:hypothetical protein